MKRKNMKNMHAAMLTSAGLVAGIAAGHSYAGETESVNAHMDRQKQAVCSGVVPDDAEVAGKLHLCKAEKGDQAEIYSCIDLKSTSGRYRLMFKGGQIPALISHAKKDNSSSILWSKKTSQQQVICDLPVADRIPEESLFKGAGVCSGESGETLPCLVYRYKGSRQTTIIDYMIIYNVDGSKVHGIVPVYIGSNNEAMTAELAYQMGLSLIGTECCSERGKRYIEYAYQLFPRSAVYLKTYQQFMPAEQMQIMTKKNNNTQE